jgi:hypothetical protein
MLYQRMVHWQAAPSNHSECVSSPPLWRVCGPGVMDVGLVSLGKQPCFSSVREQPIGCQHTRVARRRLLETGSTLSVQEVVRRCCGRG